MSRKKQSEKQRERERYQQKIRPFVEELAVVTADLKECSTSDPDAGPLIATFTHDHYSVRITTGFGETITVFAMPSGSAWEAYKRDTRYRTLNGYDHLVILANRANGMSFAAYARQQLRKKLREKQRGWIAELVAYRGAKRAMRLTPEIVDVSRATPFEDMKLRRDLTLLVDVGCRDGFGQVRIEEMHYDIKASRRAIVHTLEKHEKAKGVRFYVVPREAFDPKTRALAVEMVADRFTTHAYDLIDEWQARPRRSA